MNLRMKKSFEFDFIVTEKDIDHLNHVNNVIYVHWVLDAAEKHWDFLSTTEINDTYVWVVLRHEIDYLASAKLNDKITINTWIENTAGVKSERMVEIKNNEKILAKAVTIWCLLDKKSMKPARIPSEIIEIFT